MLKKLLKYAPICALVLAIAAFIFMMATHAMESSSSGGGLSSSAWISGVAVIFGKGPYYSSGSANWGPISIGGGGVGTFEGTLAWNGLLAFIFFIVALVALIASAVSVFVKINVLEKFGGIIALVAAGLLLVGGIFLFFAVPAFTSVNDMSADGWNLGFGWVFAGILAILGGIVSACPAVLALIEKK